MNKITLNKKKREIEIHKCNHCHIKLVCKVIYHYEKKLVMDKETMKKVEKISKIYDKPAPDFCGYCKQLPKCEHCEIILCNLEKHIARQSKYDIRYCSDCYDRKLPEISPKPEELDEIEEEDLSIIK